MRREQGGEVRQNESISSVQERRTALLQRLSTYPRLGVALIALGIASFALVSNLLETTDEAFIFVMLLGNFISGTGAVLVALFLDAETRRRQT